MPKTRKFINKKRAVSFQLVHRSQQDPLVADENAPQRVLAPIQGRESVTDKDKRLQEQQKYGIFYDDEHNYLEHLKDTKDNRVTWPERVEEELHKLKQKVKLQLPSSVFASEAEEKVGMLNKATPVSGLQLHLDPDLVAAMDEDFAYSDPNNVLEDNFLELADGVASDQEFDENDKDLQFDYDSDDVSSDFSNEQEETKSRFTNYSMSSAVIERNDNLKLLDARFDRMLATYDDSQALDDDEEETRGHVTLTEEMIVKDVEDFEREQAPHYLDKDLEANEITKQLFKHHDYSKETYEKFVVPQKPKYDCKSILSTYSNIHNHPKILEGPPSRRQIKISKRTGIPKDVLGENKLTAKALSRLDEENDGPKSQTSTSTAGQSFITRLSTLSVRPKNETSEGRRERKKELKELRKEKRKEKKNNKEAFKNEIKRQKQLDINKRNTAQGVKIM